MSTWLWLIPGSPFVGALTIALLGGRLPAARLPWFACAAAGISALTVAAAWLGGAAQEPLRQTLYIWLAVDGWQPSVGFTLDRLALVMVTVVSGVGFLIHVYSVAFMDKEAEQRRYYFYMNLFLAGMLVLVLADNLLLLYFGWEMVGLCSFALIGFWYRDPVKAAAGRKAFTVTRIGDTALAIAIFLLFVQFGTLSFDVLFPLGEGDWEGATAVALLILVGALGKSAQLPLQVWLPDAMAGPSPVSALIHAATMVTAGVYLIARTHPLFELAPGVQWTVAAIGVLTIVYGASCALAQHDIKRVLAYSTVSQIGYMFLALGCGAYALALFHLATHACFKALLFLSAGTLIHSAGGEHHIGRLGELNAGSRTVQLCFLVGAASLAAVPFFTAGFYSKDAILTAAWVAPVGGLLWLFAALGALLTGVYIFRVYLTVFHRSAEPLLRPRGRLPTPIAVPLLLLAALSLSVGFLEFPEGSGGPHTWSTWLESELDLAKHPEHHTTRVLQALSALMAVAGIALAFPLVRRERAGKSLPWQSFLQTGWRFDALYARLFVQPYHRTASALARWVEQGLIEAGLNGLTRGFWVMAAGLRRGVEFGSVERGLTFLVVGLQRGHAMLSATQNGLLSRYAVSVTTGTLALLGFWLFWPWGG